ncbi:MAG: 5'-deoxynucleotidase [Monoglobales bacterium]
MNNKSFFAMASRMKYINRWGLMRNTNQENIGQHSLEVSMIAHALAVINNEIFGGNISPERVAVVAMYHDMSEIITGDMPTPVKYNNAKIVEVYKDIEAAAKSNLLEKLPDGFKKIYEKILFCDDTEINKLVKAADKLAAYIKCIEEENAGNREFVKAFAATGETLEKMDCPELKYFMEHFMPSYRLTLDEI